MADRDNEKVEHPLTLGPKHKEEEEGLCICACVVGLGWKEQGRFTLWPLLAHTQ